MEMNVGQILIYMEIGVSLALGVVILLQQKGTGLSAAIGGGSGGGFYRSKRGVEKGLLVATIVLGVLFIVIGILSIYFTSSNVSPTHVPASQNQNLPSQQIDLLPQDITISEEIPQ